MDKNKSIKRNALVKLEVIESQGKKDPLDIMWADRWMLSDLVNKLAMYVSLNAEVIKYANSGNNKELAINALVQLSNAIRLLSTQEFYRNNSETRQLVFVYDKTAYGVTIIEEDSK